MKHQPNYLHQLFSLILWLPIVLSACGGVPPISGPTAIPTAIPTPASPTPEVVVTHPELEVLTPENITRLEQIDQWGKGFVYDIALSPDSGQIAVATATGIYLYDRVTAAQVGFIGDRTTVDDENSVYITGAIDFSPDGSQLAIANADITLWDLSANTAHGVIWNKNNDPDSTFSSIWLSPDGSRIVGLQKNRREYVIGTGSTSLVIYNVENGDLVYRQDFRGADDFSTGISFGDSWTVYFSFTDISLGSGSNFQVVDWRSGEVLRDVTVPRSFDGMNETVGLWPEWVQVGDGGYPLFHLISLDNFQESGSIPGWVSILPYSDLLLVVHERNFLVQSTRGNLVCSSTLEDDINPWYWGFHVAFSRDGKTAVYMDPSTGRGDVRIWDLEHCTVSDPVLFFYEVARDLGFTPDGQTLIAGSSASSATFEIDAGTGQFHWPALQLAGKRLDVIPSPEGQMRVTVGHDPEGLDFWDAKTGDPIYHLSMSTEGTFGFSFAISPDGRLLATLGSDGTVYLWGVRKP